MAILNVRQFGDNVLGKVCKPVKAITPRIEELVNDMYETMYDAGGVGLAAPQVGVLKRIVVIDVTPDPEEGEDPPATSYSFQRSAFGQKIAIFIVRYADGSSQATACSVS